MEIFIDTANLNEITEAFSWGIIDGITTNPSLIKKEINNLEKLNMEEYIKQIIITAKNTPVSLEVIGTDEESMLKEAKKLYKKFNTISNNIVIKIPINPATTEMEQNHYHGLKVIKKLNSENIPTNATLIMTPEQALLAAKAGATYVSPFAGRVDDTLRKFKGEKFNKTDYYEMDGTENQNGELVHDAGIVSGVDLIIQCVEILSKYNFKTKVIAASVRNARQVREIALAGTPVATIPFKVLKEMITHPETYEGMKAFKNDIVKEYQTVFSE